MNYKVKGLDIGYTYTKDDEKRIFKSAITQIDNGITGGNKIIVDNKVYYVGVGNGTVESDKANLEITKVCTLTNLAMDSANDFFIVSGLPIGQYSTQKDRLRNSLLSCNGSKIEFNGKEETIKIHDVLIYPQCAGALISSDIKNDVIVVDFGGYTIDVGYFSYSGSSFSLIKSDTWYQGMLTLYGKVITAINSHFNLTLEPYYAENILKNGLSIHGKKQDIGFINEILKDHIQSVYDELMLNYPSKTTPFAICGGGSSILYNFFAKEFPNSTIVQDSQFANAIGFKNVGIKKFSNIITIEKQKQWQRSMAYAK